jgi:hypothetical protein
VSAKGGDVTTRLIESSGISFISSDESPKKAFPYSVVKYGSVFIKSGILHTLITLVEHDLGVVAGVPVAAKYNADVEERRRTGSCIGPFAMRASMRRKSGKSQ